MKRLNNSKEYSKLNKTEDQNSTNLELSSTEVNVSNNDDSASNTNE